MEIPSQIDKNEILLKDIDCKGCQFQRFCFVDGVCRVDLINEKHREYILKEYKSKMAKVEQLTIDFK